jgi:large subunit ribosomal protein L4
MELRLQSVDTDGYRDLELSDVVFNATYNEPLVHQVVKAYMASARAGTKAQKNRAAVRGGGAKPWRQKGTGRARAGTSSSPIWRGGGRAFAAKPRDFGQKVNRKMYRGAMRSILSELIRSGRLLGVEKLSLEEPKTKRMLELLKNLGLDNVLIVSTEIEHNVWLATRNVLGVGLVEVDTINPLILLSYDKVMITSAGLTSLEAKFK